MEAKQNGEIAINLNLTTSLTSNHDVVQFTTPSSRGSGRGSRNRRRLQRAAAQSSTESNEARISSDVGSEEDQSTANENLAVDPPSVVEESPILVEQDPILPLTSQLPHAFQEPQQLTEHPTEEPAVNCALCPNQVVLFSNRAEFLRHVCVDHFHEEHLINFPEFLPNDIYQLAMKLTF